MSESLCQKVVKKRFIDVGGGVAACEGRSVVAPRQRGKNDPSSRRGVRSRSWDPQAGRREQRGNASVGRSDFNRHGGGLGEGAGGGGAGRDGSRQLRRVPAEGGMWVQRHHVGEGAEREGGEREGESGQ